MKIKWFRKVDAFIIMRSVFSKKKKKKLWELLPTQNFYNAFTINYK